MKSVLFNNENAPIHIDEPVYLLIRMFPLKEETPPAFGLAVRPRNKSFLLKDQHEQIMNVDAEEISRAEFYSWARMKVLPVFLGYQRKGVSIRDATVTHRCDMDYPINHKDPIARPF